MYHRMLVPLDGSELAEVVLRRWTEEQGSDKTLGKSLAALYARLHCQPKLEQVIAQAKTPESKADRILRAILGFAGSVADRNGSS